MLEGTDNSSFDDSFSVRLRLPQKTSRHEMLLDVINNVADLVLAADSSKLNHSISAALEALAFALNVDRVNVWRNQYVDGELVYTHEYSIVSSNYTTSPAVSVHESFSYKETAPTWLKRFNKGLIINGPLKELNADEQERLSPYAIKSLLVIPTVVQGRLWGFLSFDDLSNERTFDEEEVRLIKSGALMIASAIERTRYEKQNMRRLEQQNLMLDISQTLMSSGSVEDLINDALHQIGDFLGAHRVLVISFEGQEKTSTLEHVWVADPRWEKEFDQATLDQAEYHHSPKKMLSTNFTPTFLCNNVHKDERWSRTLHLSSEIRAFIWSWVYVDDNLWGLVVVEDCLRPRDWTDSDKHLVGTFSSVLAGAIARRTIDIQRNEALETAIKASQAKSQFLSNMSHEIRSPMNVIIGMTTIGLNAKEAEAKDSAFKKITSASQHLLAIINDILDMSKIEANKLEFSPINFDFRDMIKRTTDTVDLWVDKKQQKLAVSIDPNIPRSIYGDDLRIAQVIVNLLTNATKFTPDGGSIWLDVACVRVDGDTYTIKVSVKDTGIGIKQEQQEKLFDSFAQADTGTSRIYGGTGLGLSIAQRIISLMGGEISVVSVPGEGSTFSFVVDVQKGEEDTGPGSEAFSADDDRENINIAGRKILLVEDISVNCEIVLALLEPYHLEIDTAENGLEALDVVIARSGSYDLILMDVQMPYMDGLEATRKIRALNDPWAKTVPIVAMTANVFSDDIQKCLDSGMNGHVGKPIDLNDLLKTLRKYLHN